MSTTESVPVIETKDDLEEAVQLLGDVEQDLTKEERHRDVRVRKAKQVNADTITALQDQKEALEEEITAFALDNQDKLLEDEDGKTCHLMTGDLKFKKKGDTVGWDNKEKAIQALKDSGNESLVVVKETLHKSVLKKHEEVVRSLQALTWIEGAEYVTIETL